MEASSEMPIEFFAAFEGLLQEIDIQSYDRVRKGLRSPSLEKELENSEKDSKENEIEEEETEEDSDSMNSEPYALVRHFYDYWNPDSITIQTLSYNLIKSISYRAFPARSVSRSTDVF